MYSQVTNLNGAYCLVEYDVLCYIGSELHLIIL